MGTHQHPLARMVINSARVNLYKWLSNSQKTETGLGVLGTIFQRIAKFFPLNGQDIDDYEFGPIQFCCFIIERIYDITFHGG